MTLLLYFSGAMALVSCSTPFPTGDVSGIVRDRTAAYITDTSSGYSVHGGYGTDCAHPGAHAMFATAGTYNIYAAVDGVVASIERCRTAGENDKFDISIAIGMKGSVPVYLDYSIEPFDGARCDEGDPFGGNILVEEGDSVTKGQKIATIDAVGSGAHVHFSLGADGATICPEIFPDSVFATQTGAKQGCAAAAANTFCHELTSSEDPSRLIE